LGEVRVANVVGKAWGEEATLHRGKPVLGGQSGDVMKVLVGFEVLATPVLAVSNFDNKKKKQS
jgi:hypothetical protein